ncbi:hypothetical protein H310_06238 [Aphanomyces invadans]|uniref:Uncharacterized protein n=1 Tax=Aphanomyces invadans TaxID=157072 RepID=A0A024U7L0_9STRA|nr:hypothetical protein H310_06238 [Aphanomyces invadans]ETW01598.1 hypothetical protein H310_06238 [Aphanomyces invadans]|eukprot:XP_008869446.1 hypothetical protein H310_06238 [Aphanomyces invadans]
MSRHLLGMLYIIKQARIKPSTWNDTLTKPKLQEFAHEFIQHQGNDDCIVYYDETIINLYCKRMFGGAIKRQGATLVMSPLKDPNL